MDLPTAIENLRYFADWAGTNHGKTVRMDGDFFTYAFAVRLILLLFVHIGPFDCLLIGITLNPAFTLSMALYTNQLVVRLKEFQQFLGALA